MIVAVLVLGVARLFLVGWNAYCRMRQLAMSERIESSRDLRSKLVRQMANRN